LIKYDAASSQHETGTRVLITWVHGGEGVLVFEKAKVDERHRATTFQYHITLEFLNGMATNNQDAIQGFK
jgi:hypothetical protein